MKRCRDCLKLFNQDKKGQRFCSACRQEHLRRRWREQSKRSRERTRDDPKTKARLKAAHQRYYQSNKTEVNKRSASRFVLYQQKHPGKVKVWRIQTFNNMRKEWYGDLLPATIRQKRTEIGNQAEDLALNQILPALDFQDIYKPPNHFPFDILAKKNGRVWGIEVSIYMRKEIKEWSKELAKYLGWQILVVLVSPTWKYARVFNIDDQVVVGFRAGEHIDLTN